MAGVKFKGSGRSQRLEPGVEEGGEVKVLVAQLDCRPQGSSIH